LYTNKSPPSKAAESTPPEAAKKKKRFVLVRLSKAFYVCTPEAVKTKNKNESTPP
jgi:hypothetical protein